MGSGLELGPDTFFGDLQLPALDNGDGVVGAVAAVLGGVFDLVDNVHALEDFAEDDVAAVEPRGEDGGDEELRAVGVLARVGHAWEC